MPACWIVKVRVLREDGRHRWMESRPLTLTEARRLHASYKGLGFTSKITGGDGQPAQKTA